MHSFATHYNARYVSLGAHVLTLSLPLPWTLESLWLLVQVAAQIFIIIAIIVFLYVFLRLYFESIANGNRISAETLRIEAQHKREMEEESRRESLEEWRQEIHSLLHKIAERMDKR